MNKATDIQPPPDRPSSAPSSSGPRFTPGPWLLRKKWSNDDDALEVYPDEEVETHFIPTGVCEVNDCRDEAVANARLIAAAPDLLAALIRLLQANEADYQLCPGMDVGTAYETNSQAIEEARAAIAEALGQNT